MDRPGRQRSLKIDVGDECDAQRLGCIMQSGSLHGMLVSSMRTTIRRDVIPAQPEHQKSRWSFNEAANPAKQGKRWGHVEACVRVNRHTARRQALQLRPSRTRERSSSPTTGMMSCGIGSKIVRHRYINPGRWKSHLACEAFPVQGSVPGTRPCTSYSERNFRRE